jgi:pilus assembly protein Flp/PilA
LGASVFFEAFSTENLTGKTIRRRTKMYKVMAWMEAYLKDVKGATAIEYALIAGGISVAIVSVVFLLGDEIEAVFTAITGAMTSATAEVESSR